MADSEGPTPKVIVAVPPHYWELPEDERLAAAERLAEHLISGLQSPSS
jgi:hypothetical protein